MKLKPILSIAIATLMIISCVKHEVIPAPTPTVTLKSKFTGTIGGVAFSFNEGVNGYTCTSPNFKTTAPSTEIFYSNIASTTNPLTTPSIKIGLGTLSTSTDPSIAEFNSFFTSTANLNPNYSADCVNGFEVQYTTAAGAIYKSNPNQTTGLTVTFGTITQESDASGDYSKFVCQFNCKVGWSSGTAPNIGEDSIQITNGYFKGWFKK